MKCTLIMFGPLAFKRFLASLAFHNVTCVGPGTTTRPGDPQPNQKERDTYFPTLGILHANAFFFAVAIHRTWLRNEFLSYFHLSEINFSSNQMKQISASDSL